MPLVALVDHQRFFLIFASESHSTGIGGQGFCIVFLINYIKRLLLEQLSDCQAIFGNEHGDDFKYDKVILISNNFGNLIDHHH